MAPSIAPRPARTAAPRPPVAQHRQRLRQGGLHAAGRSRPAASPPARSPAAARTAGRRSAASGTARAGPRCPRPTPRPCRSARPRPSTSVERVPDSAGPEPGEQGPGPSLVRAGSSRAAGRAAPRSPVSARLTAAPRWSCARSEQRRARPSGPGRGRRPARRRPRWWACRARAGRAGRRRGAGEQRGRAGRCRAPRRTAHRCRRRGAPRSISVRPARRRPPRPTSSHQRRSSGSVRDRAGPAGAGSESTVMRGGELRCAAGAGEPHLQLVRGSRRAR